MPLVYGRNEHRDDNNVNININVDVHSYRKYDVSMR